MSAPLALIVKVPELEDEEPAGKGLPMSCASQGAGTAACAAPATAHIARVKTGARTERSLLTRIYTDLHCARTSRREAHELSVRRRRTCGRTLRCDAPA